MAITATNKTSGLDNTDNTTGYTTASVTFTTSLLYLFSVVSHDGASIPVHLISASGTLTFTEIATVTFNTIASSNKRLTVYRCMPSPGESTTVSFDTSGAVTNSHGRWSIDEFSGIDTSGTNGSGAIVQSVTDRSDTGTSLTVTLAALGSGDNATFGAFAHAANEVTNIGSGFTELADVAGTETPTTSFQTEWKLNDNTVDASWTTSSANAGIAIEIKAATGGGGGGIVTRRTLLGVGV